MYSLDLGEFRVEIYLNDLPPDEHDHSWVMYVSWKDWELKQEMGISTVKVRPPLERAEKCLFELGVLIPKLGEELLKLGPPEKMGVSALKRVASREDFCQTVNTTT